MAMFAPFKPLMTAPAPTWSHGALPTRLLLLDTVPLTPVKPLPQVTAPAFVADPLLQLGESTT